MPRTARSCSGGYTYHVLNRGNARATVFHKPDDYDAFLDLMAESSVRTPTADSCLLPDAQSLPPGAGAARGRRRKPLHALADDHARCGATLGVTGKGDIVYFIKSFE